MRFQYVWTRILTGHVTTHLRFACARYINGYCHCHGMFICCHKGFTQMLIQFSLYMLHVHAIHGFCNKQINYKFIFYNITFRVVIIESALYMKVSQPDR